MNENFLGDVHNKIYKLVFYGFPIIWQEIKIFFQALCLAKKCRNNL